MAQSYSKLVSSFQKTLDKCAKHMEDLNLKEAKVQKKINKSVDKRECYRTERDLTERFMMKLSSLIGVQDDNS